LSHTLTVEVKKILKISQRVKVERVVFNALETQGRGFAI
jgi:hypothetical protein